MNSRQLALRRFSRPLRSAAPAPFHFHSSLSRSSLISQTPVQRKLTYNIRHILPLRRTCISVCATRAQLIAHSAPHITHYTPPNQLLHANAACRYLNPSSPLYNQHLLRCNSSIPAPAHFLPHRPISTASFSAPKLYL